MSAENKSGNARQISMQSVNLVYIPRNYQIEAVIRAVEDKNDVAPLHILHAVLKNPFKYHLAISQLWIAG